MTFWDSSALVPLLAGEPGTPALAARYRDDPEIVVWWATPTECASALARLERESALNPTETTEALLRLDALSIGWLQVEPVDEIREVARRILRMHPLRAVDALQLAAAYLASERRPSTLAFVTLDLRLADAARREGFLVDVPQPASGRRHRPAGPFHPGEGREPKLLTRPREKAGPRNNGKARSLVAWWHGAGHYSQSPEGGHRTPGLIL